MHNSIILAIHVSKIIKFGGEFTMFWQKQVGLFFGTPWNCILTVLATLHIN